MSDNGILNLSEYLDFSSDSKTRDLALRLKSLGAREVFGVEGCSRCDIEGIIFNNNIYWLETPTIVNLGEWIPKMKYPYILIDGVEDDDDNAMLVAYTSDKNAGSELASLALASNNYILICGGEFSGESITLNM